MEMNQNDFDEVKSKIETELECLTDENQAMREFFDELAIPIVKKAVRNVEKQLRGFPREACQFGDDSKLNFFEEVCVMLEEVSMDDYMLVENTIEGCCESAYDDLSNQEKFIVNHQTISPERGGYEIVKDEFFQYATNYENRRITDSIDRRSYID
jgi:hypothetical protein